MIKSIIQEIRPKHWLKNIFILAPFLFTPEKWGIDNIIPIIVGFILFSFSASSIYIFNDLMDLEGDKKHPVNRRRAYANGEISKNIMIILMIPSIIITFLFSIIFDKNFFYIIILYIILNIFYSIYLKRIKYINFSIIAIGFLLRILAGCVIINVSPSYWILIMTFLLTYYVSIVKYIINNKQIKSDMVIVKILSYLTIIVYLFYTISPETVLHFDNYFLIFSLIPVVLGFVYTNKKIKISNEIDVVNFLTDKIYWSIYILWLIMVIIPVSIRYFI
jgi:4-hydroxybenzoate polyprenyltransferase